MKETITELKLRLEEAYRDYGLTCLNIRRMEEQREKLFRQIKALEEKVK